MNQDYSKAVSFTNSYFALADGLVSGIEYFLAENVVLDWFGKTIKGRHNVAAFMSTHKINSQHVFNDINPSDSIGYNKKSNRRRRKHKSRSSNNFLQNRNISYENELNSQITPLNESSGYSDESYSLTKINYSSEAESNFSFELHDDALSHIFKLESIKTTDVEEIEQQIRQISLEDKSNTNLAKRNCKEIKGTRDISILESSMKYVETYGEILFSKRSRRQSGWNNRKLIASGSTQTWRKPCKLQIAYSSQQVCLKQNLPANNNDIVSQSDPNLVENQSKLLKLEQIIDLSNQLVPNDNDFSGYLKDVNFHKDQGTFVKNLDEYLLKNGRNNSHITPQYINNHLVLRKNRCDDVNESKINFLFNDLIHVIIYEGKSRCRMNLSKKFI